MPQSVTLLLRAGFVIGSWHTEVQNAWEICTCVRFMKKTGVNLSNLWNVKWRLYQDFLTSKWVTWTWSREKQVAGLWKVKCCSFNGCQRPGCGWGLCCMLAALGTVSLGRVIYNMLLNLFKALEHILLILLGWLSASCLVKQNREMVTAPPKYNLVFLANVSCV